MEREGLPFCLVGGGASQAWIACLRTAHGRLRLRAEPSLRHALRATHDLNLATRAEPEAMLAALNRLAAGAGRDAQVVGARSLRLGPVAVSLTLGPDDLSGMSDLYDVFLESRVTLGVRRGATVDTVPTIGLAALLATKLTCRGDKAKDLLDLTQLLAACREAGLIPDLARVREILVGRPEALALLADVVSQVEESP